MFARIEAGLRDVLLTARPVYVGASSATGFMEMAIRNAPEGEILSLVNGGFSERFAKVAESCERRVERVVAPWGDDVRPESGRVGSRGATLCGGHRGALRDVDRRHHRRSRGRASSRTSHGAVALVDSVSGVGGAELTVDGWGLDFVLTGSQKALALPRRPGVRRRVGGVRRAREERSQSRLLLRHRAVRQRSPRRIRRRARRRRRCSTRSRRRWATSGARGSSDAGIAISRCGMRRSSGWTRAAERRDVNLGILAPAELRSPTVTVVTLPNGISTKEAREAISARGFTVGGGYGKLSDTTIRIGHMGDHTVEGLKRCLQVCEQVIAELAERRRLVRV